MARIVTQPDSINRQAISERGLHTTTPPNLTPHSPVPLRQGSTLVLTDRSSGALEEALLRDGLMTIQEATAFLRLSRSTVYGLMDRGELPYVRIGSSRRIPRRGLIHLAANHLEGESSTAGPPFNAGK
jgi:excisionase family DNA binding protein